MVDNLPEIPNWMHDALLSRAAKTISILNKLTSEEVLPGNRVKKAAMPITAFKGAKALVFSFRRKYGFLGSSQKELGFITKKYTSSDGTIAWSPPIFLNSFAVGLGITVGYYKAGYCTAILDDTALEYSLKSHILTTLRGVFMIDMNGAKVRPVQMDSASVDDNVSGTRLSGQRANYFQADAMLLDWSINISRTTLCDTWNNALYGEVPIRDVLDGKVPCPTEFMTVIDVLKRQTTAASVKQRDPRFARSASNVSSVGVASSEGSVRGAVPALAQQV
jgi:hypothetical protein